MKAPETPPRREEKAVQALISAALHIRGDDVSMDEIQKYLSAEIVLSPEDEAALKVKRKPSDNSDSLNNASHPQVENINAEAYSALHRKQPEKGFSAKTEAEIRRKREELLEKLRRKKGSE